MNEESDEIKCLEDCFVALSQDIKGKIISKCEPRERGGSGLMPLMWSIAIDFYFSTVLLDYCLPLSSHIPEINFECPVQKGKWSSLNFYRDWVAQNRPIIFRGGATHWPAFRKWQNNAYFRSRVGTKNVTVSITPNGYADAAVPINDPDNDVPTYKFVMPYEEEMSVNQFLNLLEETPEKGIFICKKGCLKFDKALGSFFYLWK